MDGGLLFAPAETSCDLASGTSHSDERIRRRLALTTRNERDVDSVLNTMGRDSSVADHLDAIRKVAERRPSLDPNGIISAPPGLMRVVTDAGAALEIGSQAAMTCWKACCGITRHWRL
jgi:hypothetical protein